MSAVGEASTEATSAQPKALTRGHSCLTCTKRKVKCDGERPCSTCAKSNTSCVSKIPQSRQNRVSKHRDATDERLKRAEALLVRHGINLEGDRLDRGPNRTLDSRRRTVPQTSNSEAGGMIVDQGQSRYVENNLWDGLSNELPASSHNTAEIDNSVFPVLTPVTLNTESLVLGGSSGGSITPHHPNPVRIFWLWQTYLENINVLIKILHVPTTQKLILESSADLTSIPSSTEALMFAIYFSALISVSDAECRKMMGEPVNILINRFAGLAQQALVNAGFMRSFSLTTLQAFVLFLLALRGRADAQTLWMTTGLAVRSAQRLGMHREKALQGLSPFEAEMRRRLWWQIIMLEGHAAKQCGVTSHAGQDFPWDTKHPLNINDGDLHPNMSEAPKEHGGLTEMLFCTTRYEVGTLTNLLAKRSQNELTVESVDADIEKLRRKLDESILRYCDPAIPTHFLALNMAKGGLSRMRLAARRRIYAARESDLPREDRDTLFRLSLDLIEQANMVSTAKILQRFLWHASPFFPVDSLIVMLTDIAYRDPEFGFPEEMLTTSWREMDISYELQPHLLQDESNAMYRALGNLATKAWEKTTTCWLTDAFPPPRFVKTLYSRKASRSNVSVATYTPSFGDNVGPENDALDSAFLSSSNAVSQDLDTWLYWQQLLGGVDDSMIHENGQPYGTF